MVVPLDAFGGLQCHWESLEVSLNLGQNHKSNPVPAAESPIELALLHNLVQYLYYSNLIFWAVSVADSWEGCNYSITGVQGSHPEQPEGIPAWYTPDLRSCRSAGPHLQAKGSRQ